MSKPNIVFITLHDTGRHFHCYGQRTVQSPAIDSIAQDGVRLTNCLCASAKCTPSRAAMMTGRWPQSNGVIGLSHAPHWWAFNEDEKHLAQVLFDNGYTTHLFHHQHEVEHPEEIGFEELHCQAPAHGWNEMPEPYGHIPAPEVGKCFARFLADRAHDKPFYAQIGFFETHHPLDFNNNTGDDELGVEIPARYADTPENRNYFKLLQGLVKQADLGVQRILRALDDNGIRDNTLLVFTVDHGLSTVRAKDSCYEPGMEVAMMLRWPGKISPGSELDGLICNIDLFPTLLELVGIPCDKKVQGRSFAPALQSRPWQDREYTYGIFFEESQPRSIRDHRYKLIRNFAPGRCIPFPIGSPNEPPFLSLPAIEVYDLAEDPDEINNIAEDAEFAEIRDRLDKQLLSHMKKVGDPILDGPVPTPYYLKAMAEWTILNGGEEYE